jgi:amino-acid N-acetyltransferase
MSGPVIGAAAASDGPEIEQLLTRCRLPLDGFRACLPDVVVARDAGRIVGCAALEVYGDGVLLRSVAVDEAYRGRGLGEALTEEALVLARSKGATAAYLLTTTASAFFPRFGFERIDRDAVPDDVRQSIEFTGACPSSAIVMRAAITGHIW